VLLFRTCLLSPYQMLIDAEKEDRLV